MPVSLEQVQQIRVIMGDPNFEVDEGGLVDLVLRFVAQATQLKKDLEETQKKLETGPARSESEQKGKRGVEDLVSTKGLITGEKFNGHMKNSQFKSWSYTLRATIKSKDFKMAELMQRAEDYTKLENEFEDEEFMLDPENREKSALLHGVLINMVEMDSEPFKILENNDGRGLECWRLFHRRWNRQRALTSIDVAEAIRKIERAKSAEEVYAKLQDHQKLVMEWVKIRGTVYHEIDYKADYLRMVPEKWVRELKLDRALQGGVDECSARELLTRIEDYVRIHTSGPAGMDIGQVEEKTDAEKMQEGCCMSYQQDQSREWEAEGGDIGAIWTGTYNPNIQCWLCWGYGHPKSKCPLNPQNKGKGKGEKGQDKGKGKGKEGGFKGFPKGGFPAKGKGKGLDKGKGKGKGSYGGYNPYNTWPQPWMSAKRKRKGTSPHGRGIRRIPKRTYQKL